MWMGSGEAFTFAIHSDDIQHSLIQNGESRQKGHSHSQFTGSFGHVVCSMYVCMYVVYYMYVCYCMLGVK